MQVEAASALRLDDFQGTQRGMADIHAAISDIATSFSERVQAAPDLSDRAAQELAECKIWMVECIRALQSDVLNAKQRGAVELKLAKQFDLDRFQGLVERVQQLESAVHDTQRVTSGSKCVFETQRESLLGQVEAMIQRSVSAATQNIRLEVQALRAEAPAREAPWVSALTLRLGALETRFCVLEAAPSLGKDDTRAELTRLSGEVAALRAAQEAVTIRSTIFSKVSELENAVNAHITQHNKAPETTENLGGSFDAQLAELSSALHQNGKTAQEGILRLQERLQAFEATRQDKYVAQETSAFEERFLKALGEREQKINEKVADMFQQHREVSEQKIKDLDRQIALLQMEKQAEAAQMSTQLAETQAKLEATQRSHMQEIQALQKQNAELQRIVSEQTVAQQQLTDGLKGLKAEAGAAVAKLDSRVEDGLDSLGQSIALMQETLQGFQTSAAERFIALQTVSMSSHGAVDAVQKSMDLQTVQLQTRLEQELYKAVCELQTANAKELQLAIAGVSQTFQERFDAATLFAKAGKSALESDIAELQRRVNQQAEALDGIKDSCSSAEDAKDAVKRLSQYVDTQISQLIKTLTSQSAELTRQIAESAAKVSPLPASPQSPGNQSTSELSVRHTAMASQVQQLQGRLHALERALDTVINSRENAQAIVSAAGVRETPANVLEPSEVLQMFDTHTEKIRGLLEAQMVQVNESIEKTTQKLNSLETEILPGYWETVGKTIQGAVSVSAQYKKDIAGIIQNIQSELQAQIDLLAKPKHSEEVVRGILQDNILGPLHKGLSQLKAEVKKGLKAEAASRELLRQELVQIRETSAEKIAKISETVDQNGKSIANLREYVTITVESRGPEEEYEEETEKNAYNPQKLLEEKLKLFETALRDLRNSHWSLDGRVGALGATLQSWECTINAAAQEARTARDLGDKLTQSIPEAIRDRVEEVANELHAQNATATASLSAQVQVQLRHAATQLQQKAVQGTQTLQAAHEQFAQLVQQRVAAQEALASEIQQHVLQLQANDKNSLRRLGVLEKQTGENMQEEWRKLTAHVKRILDENHTGTTNAIKESLDACNTLTGQIRMQFQEVMQTFKKTGESFIAQAKAESVQELEGLSKLANEQEEIARSWEQRYRSLLDQQTKLREQEVAQLRRMMEQQMKGLQEWLQLGLQDVRAAFGPLEAQQDHCLRQIELAQNRVEEIAAVSAVQMQKTTQGLAERFRSAHATAQMLENRFLAAEQQAAALALQVSQLIQKQSYIDEVAQKAVTSTMLGEYDATRAAEELTRQVESLRQDFDTFKQQVSQDLGAILQAPDNTPLTMVKETRFRTHPAYQFLSDFDPVDLQIQKQTSNLYRELVNRDLPNLQKIHIRKIGPARYVVNDKHVTVFTKEGQLVVKAGAACTLWLEWIYDVITSTQ